MKFFLKCPRIEHFRRFFRFEIDQMFFLAMPNFQNQMGKMGHFRKNEQEKVGHFGKKARDHFLNEKRTENENVRFWGISGKIAYALTCKIPPSKTFWGISRYPPYMNLHVKCCSLMWFDPRPNVTL